LSKAKITAGTCGFTAIVEAKMEGSRCAISIDSDCDAIRRLAEELTEVEPIHEISFRRGTMPRTLELGVKYCRHAACPVPVGIIKTIEVEAGLALPANVVIELKS
jgi:hypothetical protein